MALCLCGCGKETRIAPYNDASKYWTRGVPLRWLRGHNHRSNKPPYVEENRGYLTFCWIWQRSHINGGYGKAGPVLAHVKYYKQKHGSVPEGLEIDHLCRVRNCVNPDHMEAVTHAENDRRGLQTKLNVDKVRLIRKLAAGGYKLSALARRFGVHKVTVYQAVKRITWAEV